MKKMMLVVLVMVFAIPTFGLAQYSGGIDPRTGMAIPQGQGPVQVTITVQPYNGGINPATGMALTINVAPTPGAEGSVVPYSGGINPQTGVPIPQYPGK